MKHLTINSIVKFVLLVITAGLINTGLVYAEERLAVTASIANMRSGPGTKYEVLWQVEQYHPFIIVEKKGNWFKIKDFENDIAWIHKSLLGKINCVIAIKDKCNFRSKPDASSKRYIIYTIEKGVPFKVLGKKGNWLKVEHADGDVGWIHKTLVW